MQLGVKEQLDVEPGIMQANGHRRSQTVTAKDVQRTVSSDQTQLTVSDEAVEEVNKQPHRPRSFQNIPDSEFGHIPVHRQRTGIRTRQSPPLNQMTARVELSRLMPEPRMVADRAVPPLRHSRLVTD